MIGRRVLIIVYCVPAVIVGGLMIFNIVNPKYVRAPSDFRFLLLAAFISIVISVILFEAYLFYIQRIRSERPLLVDGKPWSYVVKILLLLLLSISFCLASVFKGVFGVVVFGVFVGVGLVGIAHAILNRL